MKSILLAIFTYLLICLFVIAPPALAQTMENSMYKIQVGNSIPIQEEFNVSEYNLSITSDASGSGEYGFQYSKRNSPFRFEISDTLIDFGNLSPTNPVLRTSTLTINNPLSQSYKVTSEENNQLQESKNGSVIPDTTCDNGQCNESRAGKWESTLTYGFGYRCDTPSHTCTVGDESFTEKDYYKHFADTSRKEPATEVMSGGRGIGQIGTITYKVNVSSLQPAGAYTNTITYLAIPSY